MNEETTIEVLASIEDERERFLEGDKTALGFNMQSWWSDDPEGDGWDESLDAYVAQRNSNGLEFTDEELAPYCGTVSCLAGHAVHWSNDWKLEIKRDGENTYAQPFRIDATTQVFGIDDGFITAGAEILGITTDQANRLFYLSGLADVYQWISQEMGIDVQVLKDKVQEARAPKA